MNGEIPLESVYQRVQREDEEGHVRDEFVDLGAQRRSLVTLLDRLTSLPLPKILMQDETADFLELLDQIRATAAQQMTFLQTPSDD